MAITTTRTACKGRRKSELGVQKLDSKPPPNGLRTGREEVSICNSLSSLVGPPGFEPGTSCTPSKRASQAAPRPDSISLAHAQNYSYSSAVPGTTFNIASQDAHAAGTVLAVSIHWNRSTRNSDSQ